MASLKDIFGWFEKNDYPTQEQFQETWKSFWHKSERLPLTQVLDLVDTLKAKADALRVQSIENKLPTLATKDDLQSVMGGLNPMGDASDMADLNTKPKRDKDSYFVLDQKNEHGDPYIFKYDIGLDDWINTKQVVYQDVARAGGSNETIKTVDDKIENSNYYLGINPLINSKIFLFGYWSNIDGSYTGGSTWATIAQQKYAQTAKVGVVDSSGNIVTGVRVLFWSDSVYLGNRIISTPDLVTPPNGTTLVSFNFSLTDRENVGTFTRDEILTFSVKGILPVSERITDLEANVVNVAKILDYSTSVNIVASDIGTGFYNVQNNGALGGGTDWYYLKKKDCPQNTTIIIRDEQGVEVTGIRLVLFDKNGNLEKTSISSRITTSDVTQSIGINFRKTAFENAEIIQYTLDEIITFSIENLGVKLSRLDNIEKSLGKFDSFKPTTNALIKGYYNNADGFLLLDNRWRTIEKRRISEKVVKVVDKDGNTIKGVRILFWDESGAYIRSVVSGSAEVPINAVDAAINFCLDNGSFPSFTNYTVEEILSFSIIGLANDAATRISKLEQNLADVNQNTSIKEYNTSIMINYASKGVVLPENGTILMSGASFASSDNGWFELACEKLGQTPINKAIGGEAIADTANRMRNGTLWSEAEFEQHDAFLIMQVHDKDVFKSDKLRDNYEDYHEDYPIEFDRSDYAAAYDYVIKRYIAECYNQKDNEDSKWFNKPYGKPCQIILCTHWHDARATYNDSIRRLSAKWGLPLICFDENIGFSKNSVHPITKQQTSLMFTRDTQTINGVVYGFHPLIGENEYIQQRMAQIVVNQLK